MEIDFFDPSESLENVKATAHKSGKLGFSSGAAKRLGLKQGVAYLVGRNRSEEEDRALYFKETSESNDKGFRVAKAGDYFYLRIKNILDALGYDYVNETVIFNIQEIGSGEERLFKLVRKPHKKR